MQVSEIAGTNPIDPPVSLRHLADASMHEHRIRESPRRIDDRAARTIEVPTDKHCAGAAPDCVPRVGDTKQLHAGSP